MTFSDFTPAADIFIAQFYEKNWSIVFVFPVDGKNLSLISVDLHDRTGPDERVHRIVIEPDEPIYALTEIEVLDQTDRNLSPDLDQS
jgi:hypothetical protein